MFSLDVDETTALVMASILFCAVSMSLIEESCFMLLFILFIYFILFSSLKDTNIQYNI